MICSPACSILSLQRELIAESEADRPPADANGLPLSQERLIRKAAGLSYFLTNEVMVAPVRQRTNPSDLSLTPIGPVFKGILKKKP